MIDKSVIYRMDKQQLSLHLGVAKKHVTRLQSEVPRSALREEELNEYTNLVSAYEERLAQLQAREF